LARSKKLLKEQQNEDKRSLIAHYRPKSIIAEQYRTIRTSIQFLSVKNSVNVIAITSSLPKEGKSTTSTNLAIVFAQQNYKVLLVDADLRRPRNHHRFKLDNYRGLTNFLFKDDNLTDLVQTTNIKNLHLLTSGPIPPNPAELLGSDRMDQFLELAKKHYDYIIIDTPPILSVTDALILAQKCDGTILVTTCGKTGKENVVKAKDLLIQTGGHILGVVLNRRKNKLNKEDQLYYAER